MDAPDEPFLLPVDGSLDLHTFSPADSTRVTDDYLEECARAGILEVRVIHGKGIGAMRRTILASLAKNPRVAGVRQAPPGLGGWGAVIVTLKPE
ncbi:MAG: Smr/MutS family protein [Proteobacteria bacterium]|nr:Smr/MutS family protein [Pseudomonadota bacterium]